ncbi:MULTISPECIES: hypothetical protein [Pseudoalteromonas]|jgi:Na+(H+)/acetate symporter ActP|uniref:Bacteriocin n=2 Tax=Pseudoalteromonas TaxID=53246 RepID=A0ABD4EPS6_9GAMM|nr:MULTISPECIES: hypothetical protein [Pseudoalteromonas]KYL34593.1 hypothetical protein A2I96_15010 [Pseudoalteromonas spiralis]MAY57517.1 hypothetical protein [Pseudoalteromonas sp.]OUV82611.1 MAG: hypothetical protein CBC91_01470 [Rickettsiales bacterium TMED131]TMS60200.1 hypothetical protein CWC10_17965 [Pseudoalteromonas sp. S3173]TMS92463.1 hypothetical protein CWB58_14225 [Pseudoalteromonas sp. S201]|tara:strand:- start:3547 stop:3759 length:213 start_codon:yes stop_codon:yes gene_type:complete
MEYNKMRELNVKEIQEVNGGGRSLGATGLIGGAGAWGAAFVTTSALAGAMFMTGGLVLVAAGAAYYASQK